GSALTIAEVLLPFLTSGMEAVATWLADNRDRIRGWARDVVGYLERVRNDVVALFTGRGDIQLEWVQALIRPFEFLKSVVLDVGDALQGNGFGNRNTWLRAAGDAARELWLVLGAVVATLLGLDGGNFAQMFDLTTVLDGAAAAMQS